MKHTSTAFHIVEIILLSSLLVIAICGRKDTGTVSERVGGFVGESLGGLIQRRNAGE